ncbi:ornithine carbamoyltransferase [Abditibacteriota bacterium]|nr:ornithine carbamoyltransferase [Abditibacteriota bacterium]
MNHFLSIQDLTRDDALFLIAEAKRLKRERVEHPSAQFEILRGQTLAMVFEKPSLRTRVSFEAAMAHCGGHAIYLAPSDIGLGKREAVADVARVLGGMCDAIMARVFAHKTVVELAQWAGKPVINGLCDMEHPCQAIADLQTLAEFRSLENRKIAYIGDGNNVCHSLMLLCAKVGVEFSCATPEGYEPVPYFVQKAQEEGKVSLTHDPREAVEGADCVYTDVWTSMGQEEESARRLEIFPPFQINEELLSAAKPDALVLHCLPAHRGEEISAETFELHSPEIFAQAQNRLHAQKAVLLRLMNHRGRVTPRPLTSDA